MNLEEIKVKFIQYLSDNNKLDNEKISKLSTTPTSIFLSGPEFIRFIKENYSELGIKEKSKIPNSIYEILAMQNDKGEEKDEFDINDLNKPASTSSTETTFNKDRTKNRITNKYDKSGKLSSQEMTVYNATGSQKSKYITTYGKQGGIDTEFQMEYGAGGAKNDLDMEIGYTEQGKMGDCWLLSALNSLSYTDKGKNIIKNAITKNKDGSYSVEFKGVNTKIKITDEEIKAARASGKYADGDDDVLLFELGYESVIRKIENGQIKVNGNHPGFSVKPGANSAKPLESGNLEDAIFLLTGDDVKSEFKKLGESTEEFDKILSSLKDNPGKYAAMLGISAGNNPLVLRDVNGKEICKLDAGTNHAFSIKSVDDEGVTIVNPWDSSKEYKISLADARKFSTGIQYYALDDSFVETDNLDSSALDASENQSGTPDAGGNVSPGTSGGDSPVAPTPNGGGDTPTPVNPVNPSDNGNGDNTNPTNDQDKNTKPLDQMSKEELNTEKTNAQNTLANSQQALEAATNGTDADLTTAKTNVDDLYNKYQEQLKAVDQTMSAKLDELVQDAKNKEDDYGKAEIEESKKAVAYSDAETAHTNAEAKVSEMQSSLDALKGTDTSSMTAEQKADVQSKISAAESALAQAKDEEAAAKQKMEQAKTDWETAKTDRDTKKQAFEDAKKARTDYEAEILKAHPEVEEAQKAYEAAQVQYEADKQAKIDEAKNKITEAQTRVSDVDKALNSLEIKDKKNELNLTSSAELFDKNITLNSEYVNHNGTLPYLVVGPENPDPNKEYPVLVFLHGSGEKGKGESALRGSSLAYVLENGKLRNGQDVNLENFNGYVIFPQAPSGYSWKGDKGASDVQDVLKDFETTYKGGVKIDKNNISLAGHSDGAVGAQFMAGHFNDKRNDYKLKKVAILSGFPSNYSLKEKTVPVRAYAGDNDDKNSLKYTQGLKGFLGNDHVFIVGSEHGSVPEHSYNSDLNHNGRSDFLEWMFSNEK